MCDQNKPHSFSVQVGDDSTEAFGAVSSCGPFRSSYEDAVGQCIRRKHLPGLFYSVSADKQQRYFVEHADDGDVGADGISWSGICVLVCCYG
ncbi:hypothetical protein SNE40_010974 [Patella caerulea]|uniref:Uncharacterized protein n=1 Tax=Patella caerulea TaxID=87958 RepID=A0AAN8JVK5_PATCE